MAAADAHCPLCGAAAVTEVGRVRTGAVVRCGACGLGWVDHPNHDDQLYDEAFFDAFREEEFAEERERTLALHLETLARLHPPGPELLDVGAALGDFVAMAADRGWRATGVEPAATAVAKAEQLGRPVLQGDLDHPDIRARRFDAIHLSHVLEHLSDPFEGLRQCVSMLAPGGLLAIEVPNEFDNLFRQARRVARREGAPDRLTDEHLWFFNRQTVVRAVTDAGLSPELVRTRNWTPLTSRLLFGDAVKRGVDRVSRWLGRGEVIEVYARKAR
ncbi:MAG: methyltransferase domain-containing protein [Acidimicrobiales bacterium]|nr:methyltransferase domain-containing protein [Acidimicrobiales bacterium]